MFKVVPVSTISVLGINGAQLYTLNVSIFYGYVVSRLYDKILILVKSWYIMIDELWNGWMKTGMLWEFWDEHVNIKKNSTVVIYIYKDR